MKITALSTPIFARKAAFCSIFQDLHENAIEVICTFQILRKSLAPNFKIPKYLVIFWYFGLIASYCIQYFDTLLVFWILLLEISKICTQYRTPAPRGRPSGAARAWWCCAARPSARASWRRPSPLPLEKSVLIRRRHADTFFVTQNDELMNFGRSSE